MSSGILFILITILVTAVRTNWAEEFEDYSKHRCIRPCTPHATLKICEYNFTLEWYHTLSKACYDCPKNLTDCSRPHCIPANGVPRGVMVVNREIPGPTIQVCLGDMIRVNVKNRLDHAEGTSIHWHGLFQRNGDQYMDGVSQLTQCAIPSRSTFQYNFMAANPGTHFWHSHSGMQRGDGVFGSLIVRHQHDPHASLYDYDLPEHVLIVNDWMDAMIVAQFSEHHHAGGSNKPESMLINGSCQCLQLDDSMVGAVLFSGGSPGGWSIKLHQKSIKSRKGAYKAYKDAQNKTVYTPREVIRVKKGSKYRIRVISNGLLNCPIRLSVEGHRMLMIASDGNPFKPVPVDAFNLVNGERYDFVLHANATIGNYWIRAAGLLDCDDRFYGARQTAILRYDGAPDVEPRSPTTYQSMVQNDIALLNPINKENSKYVTVNQLEGLNHNPALEGKPTSTFYLAHDFIKIDNPHMHHPELYPIIATKVGKHLYSPQINNITMTLPPAPPLTQYNDIPKELFCKPYGEKNCTEEFCECVHMIEVGLGELVELFLIDSGVIWDVTHPMHLHGYAFGVVGMDRVGKWVSRDHVIRLNKEDKVKRKLKNIPNKDSIMVPDGGYTVIRIKADNPGFWFYHCHNEFHQEIGMGLVLKVGNPSKDIQRPPPRNWPKCGDFWFSFDDPGKPRAEEIKSCRQLLRETSTGAIKRTHYILLFTLLLFIFGYIL